MKNIEGTVQFLTSLILYVDDIIMIQRVKKFFRFGQCNLVSTPRNQKIDKKTGNFFDA